MTNQKTLNSEVLYDIYCDGDLHDNKGRTSEYIIAFVNDIIDNMNNGLPKNEQVNPVKDLYEARKIGRELCWKFPLHND